MIRAPDKTIKRAAFTLVELLASMGILSVLLLLLGLMLETSLGRFRSGAERVEQSGDARVVALRLERDLSGVIGARPGAVPRLPGSVSAVQRGFFEGRIFLPFEVDRREGSDNGHGGSFANAAPGFATLAFVTQVPGPDDPAKAPAPAIAGYYVAYARHSPLAGEMGAGMKLFRHYRRGGHPTGAGYADPIVRRLADGINDGRDSAAAPAAGGTALVMANAPLRVGKFENADLPFIFSEPRSGTLVHPWPNLPVAEALPEPPPDRKPSRGSSQDWADPASEVHDSVFPDEAICDHVVRFEIRPWRVVKDAGGALLTLDAAGLNAHLGLAGGDEWPVLVTPDFCDLVISVIPEATARRLDGPEDWFFDWSDPGIETTDDRVRGMRTQRFRIHLPGGDT